LLRWQPSWRGGAIYRGSVGKIGETARLRIIGEDGNDVEMSRRSRIRRFA
jgi:hypothetical protein